MTKKITYLGRIFEIEDGTKYQIINTTNDLDTYICWLLPLKERRMPTSKNFPRVETNAKIKKGDYKLIPFYD